jgi:murein DD-endopeptidase MepM/ murein hydrolase activator NlpD
MKKIFFLFICFSFFVFFNCTNKQTPQTIREEADSITIETKPSTILYGITADNMEVIRSQVPKNKTLGSILSEYGVSASAIHNLAEKSKKFFDVRKIKTGNNFCILLSGDSIPVVRHFIYEINPVDYIIYSLADSFSIQMGAKDIEIQEKIVEGEISTSLWNTVVEAKAPLVLAGELSNIYAWNIDFFGLQKGDKFKVHYTEKWVDSSFICIDSIKCAVFEHSGQKFYAIPFHQDDRIDYYDKDGSSLRKAFLKAPLKYSRVSSSFSHSRMHPVLKIRRPHHGVDYAAPVGTPVMSIGDGKVIKKGYDKGGGHTVKIQHNSSYATVYMHLSKYAKDIKVGAFVKQGDIIGYVGSTGLSTGPHLDFRVYKDGKPIDPLKMESPPVSPVKKEYLSLFYTQRDSLITNMEKFQTNLNQTGITHPDEI